MLEGYEAESIWELCEVEEGGVFRVSLFACKFELEIFGDFGIKAGEEAVFCEKAIGEQTE